MSSNILPKLILIVMALPTAVTFRRKLLYYTQEALSDCLIDMFVKESASIKEPAS